MANTAAKKITYDGKPVQVESAIRDGTGLEINATYLKKTDYLRGKVVAQYQVPGTQSKQYIIAEWPSATPYTGVPGFMKFAIIVDQVDTFRQSCIYEATWGSNGLSLVLLSNNRMSGIDEIKLCIPVSSDEFTTYPPIITAKSGHSYEKNITIIVLESSENNGFATESAWKTAWDTEITNAEILENRYYTYVYTNYQIYSSNGYVSNAENANNASYANRAYKDNDNNIISSTYATKAQVVEYFEYTQPVLTSQEYLSVAWDSPMVRHHVSYRYSGRLRWTVSNR